MFDKDTNITGKHGAYMHRLVSEFYTITDSAGKKLISNRFFKNQYDAYKIAAIIGFLYGKKGEKMTARDEKNETATIFASQMTNIRDDLIFNYRLIMLLDEQHEPNFDERLQKAFNYYGDEEKSKSDRELFEQYTLGGIEVLYEKLIGNATKQEDYLANLICFVQEFEQRYNSSVDSTNLVELSRRLSSIQ